MLWYFCCFSANAFTQSKSGCMDSLGEPTYLGISKGAPVMYPPPPRSRSNFLKKKLFSFGNNDQNSRLTQRSFQLPHFLVWPILEQPLINLRRARISATGIGHPLQGPLVSNPAHFHLRLDGVLRSILPSPLESLAKESGYEG